MPKIVPKKERSRRSKKFKTSQSQPIIRPNAGGIDVGATELYVTVPLDADTEPVRISAWRPTVLQRSRSPLGDFFRRMKARLGSPAAITATVHKLARILHHLIKHRGPYDTSVFAHQEELHRQRRERHLRKQAALFGFQLTPLQSNG